MAYKYDDTKYWIEAVLPIQQQMKPYVTVEQCRVAWGLAGKSATQRRLNELVRRGMAERIRVGNIWHYHLKELE